MQNSEIGKKEKSLNLKNNITAVSIAIILIITYLVGFSYKGMENPYFGVWSIVPALVAVIFAFITREALFSLLIAALAGIFIQGKGFWGLSGLFTKALGNGDFIWVVLIEVFIGILVAFFLKTGSTKEFTRVVGNKITGRKKVQILAWFLGMFIFFTLITTWVGAELSYIQDGIKQLNLNETPYIVFINSLQYAFYPIFTLGFILILIYSGKDYGPMRRAELMIQDHSNDDSSQHHSDEEFLPKKGIKTKAYNALIPVMVVIFGTISGLVITGLQAVDYQDHLGLARNLSQIVGHADSYVALLWSSLAGTFVAVGLSVSQRLLTLKESMDSMVDGFRLMMTAVLILTLAWALAMLTENIKTAEFISGSLIDMNLNPYLIPGLSFVLAALVAFSTGSSWGTMAILYPLMLPATWLLAEQAGLDYQESLSVFHNVVSVVLAGSVMGDHCSPISDTTIMSSLASQCNHIEHVRTQLPYALTVGVVALFIGTIPASFGFPVILSYLIGFCILVVVVFFFGKQTNSIS